MARQFSNTLKRHDYTDLHTTRSMGEALRLLGIESTSEALTDIELIIMDLNIPARPTTPGRGDGQRGGSFELCSMVRATESLESVPIIMVAPDTDEEAIERAFRAGANDYVAKPPKTIELISRVRSALAFGSESRRRIEKTAELAEANRKLEHLSNTDSLTGIYNRRNFDEYLERSWKMGARSGTPLSLILLDIDFFKDYNDTYGHQGGDDCLRSIAKAIKGVIHRPGDLLARYGGEEFAVILPETESTAAISIAETICREVEALEIGHENSQIGRFVTLSLGVSTIYPAVKGPSATTLVESSDEALYEAKREGRNRVKSRTFEYSDKAGEPEESIPKVQRDSFI